MFRIDTHRAGSTHVDILVSGRLTGNESAQLDGVVGPHVKAGRSVHLDLSRLSGTDHQGIALLLALADRGVRLAHCPPFLTLWLRAEHRSRIREIS
jgi:ABC-type transporter Mla MlaB component